MMLSFVSQHLFPPAAAALENKPFSLLKLRFQVYDLRTDTYCNHAPRNNLLPAHRYELDRRSESLRPLRVVSRQKMTSVISLQEVCSLH